ncbi:MAG: DUF3427 domain-containing protein [Bacteroidota bacterium]
MNPIITKLNESLKTGFIDKSYLSSKDYLPQLLVNDKTEQKKVLTTILKELNACDEFWFSVAFATTSGVAALINTLSDLQNKGIKGKILVSQYLNFTQPEALKRLLLFKNIEVKIAIDDAFHSKGYLFKKGDVYDLIIGSSNLTASALCSNAEWNLKITATPTSHIIFNAIKEFTSTYERAAFVDADFIKGYEVSYKAQFEYTRKLKTELENTTFQSVIPNLMQNDALHNLEQLRAQGKDKALLISATGTGKTYLSAFDAKKVNPQRLLFVVHRLNIAKASKKTFEKVFAGTRTTGIFSGGLKDVNADFVFSTVQTICKEDSLSQFSRDHFDYIVIDETHRAGAHSYKKILDYFTPKFLLGMTATPERTDGLDVFKQFDYNIAYEIRLHKALEENMLSPFHYYGVRDISVNGKVLEEISDFKLLIADERIDRIIEKAKFFGCDDGEVRGLIFCSNIDECKKLSLGFNQRGFRTIALTGNSDEAARAEAIERLESNDKEDRLDYIFTVDIFNEGVDIPSVNQVIMLRPTQSAIIFVQQLGRGLRKTEDKDYLTVIDFIGNYKNNFLVPIALYGDTSYNKDTLRKLMASGSSLIPGTSTINFDKISRDRIYESIDSANMSLKRDLTNDYNYLKSKLGRIPMMIDFLEHGSRDPLLYVTYSKSYFNFVAGVEDSLANALTGNDIKVLQLFSLEINNSKRVEECLILKRLIKEHSFDIASFKNFYKTEYGYPLKNETITSCINNLNFGFITELYNKRLVTVQERYKFHFVRQEKGRILLDSSFLKMLSNKTFLAFLEDSTNYSIRTFNKLYNSSSFEDGFVLYRKYSRKDTFRILNWKSNPLAQNVGGYIISPDKSNCPIFVNYHKGEDISNTTKYEDGFIDSALFEWMSKSKRTLNSPDVKAIMNHKDGLRLPLFIKKNNDEGTEFYYMGNVTPKDGGYEQTTMQDDDNKPVSVVKVVFHMNHIVEDSIYEYLTNNKDAEPKNLEAENTIENKLPFRILPVQEIKQYLNSIPLMDIGVAAGSFSDDQLHLSTEWVELLNPFKYSSDYFICKVSGESMNKIIPSDSWCLFKKYHSGSREGKIVLAEHSDIQDAGFGSGYTIKEYHSEKEEVDGSWQHTSIVLKPKSFDSNFKPIVLDGDEAINLKIVGIFDSVLT